MSGADKDDFFQFFPDVISQAVLNTYNEAFPKSSSIFDANFEKELVGFIYKYVCGIKPYKVTENWPKKSVIVEEASKDINDDLDIDGNQDRETSKVSRKIPSMVVGPNFMTQRIWFDVYGNSPIVSHYLNVTGSKNERRHLMIHRSQILKDYADDESILTYRQIVQDSMKKSKIRDKSYSQKESIVRTERNTLISTLNSQLTQDHSKKINQTQIKDLSTQIIEAQTLRRKQKMSAQRRNK